MAERTLASQKNNQIFFVDVSIKHNRSHSVALSIQFCGVFQWLFISATEAPLHIAKPLQ